MTCGRKLGPFDCCSVVEGDCLELMKQLPDGCVDAVITDPPYGTASYATDTRVFDETCFLELLRLGFVTAVFGWPERLVALCVSSGKIPDEWVTWWPTNAGCRSFNPSGLARDCEAVAIFGEGNWKNVLIPRGAASARILSRDYGSPGRGLKHGHSAESRYAGDVWTDASPGLGFLHAQRLHPNEKPLAVLERIVIGLTLGGEDGEDCDIVLDPFLGSGTTAVAAKKLGRHYLGFEISPDYCRIARERIALVEAQPNLFEPKPEQLELVGGDP